MKQTAVEWLEEKIKKYPTLYFLMCLWFDEAKELEKQQIVDAYQQGFNNAYFSNPLSKEQYYNETFNK
jgi:hypothetical protein